MRLGRWNSGKLREAAIDFGAEIGGGEAACPPEYRLDQHPLANARGIDALPYRDHAPAGVSALNARKLRQRTGPA